MHPFPHRYTVTAGATPHHEVALASAELPVLSSAPPVEFDGPGDHWSPETLLVAAVADCFVLTFRALARAAHLPWTTLDCRVTGTLERVERLPQFTRFDAAVRLEIPAGAAAVEAQRLLARAERSCLVSQSLKAAVHLRTEIHTAAASRLPADPHGQA